MNRPFVKVCGVTRAVDALAAARLGVNAIGFILASESPRAIDPAAAAAIARALPEGVARVGVTVNASATEVAAWRDAVGLTALQAHGEETADLCRAYGIPVVKAIRPHPGFDPAALDGWRGVALLVDADDADRRGGTGRLADWSLARALVERGHRVVLAGGLAPENLEAAVRDVGPLGVDLNSGVETAPGVKDAARIEAALRVLASWPPHSSQETPWPSFPI